MALSSIHGDSIELNTAMALGMEPFYDLEELNGNLEAKGMFLEIMEAFVEEAPEFHFKYDLIQVPFARVKLYLAENIIQVYFCFAKNADREKLYQYTDTPLYPVNFGILVRADDTEALRINTFEEMERLGGTLMGVRGTSALRVFQEQAINLNIPVEDAPTIEQNLKKLMANRGRYFTFNHYSLIDGARKLGYEDKVALIPLIVEETYHWLAFSNNVSPEIVQKANTVLHKLDEKGELRRIYEKYGTLR